MPKNDFKVPSILLYSTRKTQKLDRTGALKGGTLSDFLTSILLQNNKKSKALWKHWKFFPKKVAKCCKKQGPFNLSGIVCWWKMFHTIILMAPLLIDRRTCERGWGRTWGHPRQRRRGWRRDVRSSHVHRRYFLLTHEHSFDHHYF